jgi:hypothetical protein
LPALPARAALVSRFLDPVPLVLGGLAGALAGAIASYAVDGSVNWPLVVSLLVATLVTLLAMLIGAGPTRQMRPGHFGPPPGRWQFRGGAMPSGGLPPQERVGPRSVSGRGPFDRFDHTAKHVLALSQDEAIRFNHNYIGTEHLLLGLLREGDGIAARVLTSLGVDLSKCRTAVEFIIGRGESTVVPSEITLSPRTKRIIELATDEARQLGHHDVGSAHLLLGLVREGEGIGAGVLQSLGVDFAAVRAKVIELMPKKQPPPPPPPSSPPPAS